MKKMINVIFCLLLISTLAMLTGCEYNVAEPLWNQPHAEVPTPEITSITPAGVAVAGANTIMIEGVNFGATIESNDVYFDNVPAEIMSASSTSITVRRPNLVADSALVKVSPHEALVVATHGPYGIDPVMGYYGNFLENAVLSAAALDADENLYVFQRTSPASVVKVTPDGEPEIFADALDRAVTDAKMGPDGLMILLRNNRDVTRLNLETGEETEWINLSKSVTYGDLDANGNLYVGGRRSDLIVVLPDESSSQIGEWTKDEILWVRVYEDYVYVLVDIARPTEENPDMSIWRHAIDGAGNVGARELVLNWTETGEYAESTPSCFTFSTDGLMLVGTDYTHPIMLFNPATGTQDILYKEILPTTAQQLVWGNDTNVYMILSGESNNMVRIDMGAAGAPYHGR